MGLCSCYEFCIRRDLMIDFLYSETTTRVGGEQTRPVLVIDGNLPIIGESRQEQQQSDGIPSK